MQSVDRLGSGHVDEVEAACDLRGHQQPGRPSRQGRRTPPRSVNDDAIRRATSSASWVLPTPPAPVTVTRRDRATNSISRRASSSRPISVDDRAGSRRICAVASNQPSSLSRTLSERTASSDAPVGEASWARMANARSVVVAGRTAPRGAYPHLRVVGDLVFVSGTSATTSRRRHRGRHGRRRRRGHARHPCPDAGRARQHRRPPRRGRAVAGRPRRRDVVPRDDGRLRRVQRGLRRVLRRRHRPGAHDRRRAPPCRTRTWRSRSRPSPSRQEEP